MTALAVPGRHSAVSRRNVHESLGTVERPCDNCPLASRGAVKVPGYGITDRPLIAFVAEAPGENEQKQGKPLIGVTGQFLRRMVNDLGIRDEECYYTNTCMCKPLTKESPSAEMVNACYDGLLDELNAVHPNIVVLLGSVSAKAVGQYERGIMSVRGMYRELLMDDGTRVGMLPTYHPSAVRRDPDKFRDIIKDLERAVRIAKGAPAVIPPPIHNYKVVERQRDLDELFPTLESSRVLAVDLETVSRDVFNGRILDIGFGWKKGEAAAIDWELASHGRNWGRLKRLLESVPVSMQTSSFDFPWLWHRGIKPRLVFDTEIGDWLLDERMGGHNLDAMATHYFDAPPYKQIFRKKWGIPPYVNDETEFARLWAKIPDRARRVYNATDCDYTYRLTIAQKRLLKKQGMLPLMKLLIRSTILYSELYLEGICVDTDRLDELERELRAKADKAKRKLTKLAPHVNPASPKQLAAYLFDELRLPSFGGAKADGSRVDERLITKGMTSVQDPEAQEYWRTARLSLYEGAGTAAEGRGLSTRSTSAVMLFWLAQYHPYPKLLIEYKRAAKLVSTYCTPIRKYLWPDKRVRPDYKLDGTVVGRFKTSKPALHNLPFGSPVYNVYVAPPGYTILHADYRQVDLRVMACFSQDENLVEWLKGDPHDEALKIMMAKTMSEKDVDDLKKTDPVKYSRLRVAAKMINFGIPYGRSATNLAPQLGVPVDEARTFIKDYWKRLSDLYKWAQRQGPDLIRNNQEHVGIYGNKRRFPLILDDKHRQEIGRLAVHFPIMSCVNYMSAESHVRAVEALRSVGIDAKVYPHIHDAINIAVPEEHVERSARIVAREMAQVPIDRGLDLLPFEVEVSAGYRWGEQKKVYQGTGGVTCERWLQ